MRLGYRATRNNFIDCGFELPMGRESDSAVPNPRKKPFQAARCRTNAQSRNCRAADSRSAAPRRCPVLTAERVLRRNCSSHREHLTVGDTSGLLPLAMATYAGLKDRDGGAHAARKIAKPAMPSLPLVWADSGYAGTDDRSTTTTGA